MNQETWPADHRAGFVSITGKPNVGKSTLMNAYLGQKISIVSALPQTTRRRLLGILTLEQAQIILVDTPGIHNPQHKLGQAMLQTALDAIPDADLVLWLVDASVWPDDQDRQVADLLHQAGRPERVILALNKSDLVSADMRPARAQAYLALFQPAAWTWVSAAGGEGRQELLDLLIAHLPTGPRYYPQDQVTDQTERAVAAELIREQVLQQTYQEVPHAVEVMIDEFKERSPTLVYIHATLIVERDTQRSILLGHNGRTIKVISQAARREIEQMIEAQVYLELWVQVRPQWRHKKSELKSLGYTAN